MFLTKVHEYYLLLIYVLDPGPLLGFIVLPGIDPLLRHSVAPSSPSVTPGAVTER